MNATGTLTQTPTRTWDQNATSWARHVRDGGDITRTHIVDPALVEIAGDVTRLDVLDAGCGEGLHSRMFARLGARVTGIDASAPMIAMARHEERREPLGIRYAVGTLERPRGVKDRSMDLVIVSMVLMSISEVRAGLVRLARVLRPAGRMLIVINHPCFMGPEEDYFTPEMMRWRFYDGQRVKTRHFHRPLSAYVHSVREAGLQLRGLHEPRVSRASVQRHPALAVHLKIPLVVILDCAIGR
jgi:SAM-dependent methyltransferase